MSTVREYRIMIHLPSEDRMKLCLFGASLVSPSAYQRSAAERPSSAAGPAGQTSRLR
jgi:hypothetical protein